MASTSIVAPGTINLTLIQGEDRALTFVASDSDGDAIDLTAATVYCSIDELDGTSIVDLVSTIAGQIDIDPDQVANTGQFVVNMSSSVTGLLTPGQTYQWDVWIERVTEGRTPVISASPLYAKKGIVDFVPGAPLAGPGSTNVPTVFVYDEGATQAGNVFNDWSDMMAQVGTVTGLRMIHFKGDESTIPAGTWDLTDVRFFGTPANPGGDNFPLVNVTEGAVLDGLRWITGVDIANNATATPPVDMDGSTASMQYFLLDGGAQIQQGTPPRNGTGTVPFLDVTGGSALVFLKDGAVLSVTTNNAAAIRLSGGALVIWVNDFASVFQNSLETTGSGSGFVTITSDAATVANGAITGSSPSDITIDTNSYHSNQRFNTDTSLDTSATRNVPLGQICRQDTTSGAATLTLGAIPQEALGRIIGVINEAGANDVTIEPQSGDTLNNVVDGTVVLSPGESVLLIVGEAGVWSTLAANVAGGGGGTDELVTVSANDTTPGRLIDKVVAGTSITINEVNDGGNETIEVVADPHTLGGAQHTSATLAEINALVSDATLDDSGDSRPPSGAAGGDLAGTYPNPTVSDGADGTAVHDNVAGEIAAVTEKVTPASADVLLIEDSADSNNKKRVQIGNLPSGGGGGSFGGQNETLEQGFDLYIDDTDTGFRAPADNQIDVFVNGTDKLRIDATALSPRNSMELGTAANPFPKLYLSNASGQLVFTAANTYIQGDTGAARMRFYVGGGQILDLQAATTSFAASGSNRLILNSTALEPRNGIALGTLSNAWAALRLTQNGTGLVLDTDGDTRLYSAGDDDMRFVVGGSTRAELNNSQLRVGADGGLSLGSDFRGWSSLYLSNEGTYSTDPITDAVVSASDAQAQLFHVTGPGSTSELWVAYADGTTKQLDTAPADITGGILPAYLRGSLSSNQTSITEGSQVEFDTVEASSGSGISLDTLTGIITVAANKQVQLRANVFLEHATLAFAQDYAWYDVTAGAEVPGSKIRVRSTSATADWSSQSVSMAIVRPTVETEYEFRRVAATVSTDGIDVSADVTSFEVMEFAPSGTSPITSIEGAVGSAPGGTYATSGIDYLEFRQGSADTIEFQFIAQGNFTIELAYAMSAADTGDIDLRVDTLGVSVGDDPNGSLSSGTVTTIVPGNDVNAHLATSANFDVTADDGDLVKVLIERPNTDTHTGDVRVLDIRIRASN